MRLGLLKFVPFPCSEEISFYQGSTRERLTISKTFGDLVSLETVQKLLHVLIMQHTSMHFVYIIFSSGGTLARLHSVSLLHGND